MMLHIGQKVRHKDIYGGKETFEIIGLKKDEVLLEGDFSGGTHKVIQESWVPKKGLILQNIWGEWIDPDDDLFERMARNVGPRD